MIQLIAMALGMAAALAAQDGAILTGAVSDPRGAAIAGAQVRLFRQDGGTVLRTVTDGRGVYRFERLAPGAFILEVEQQGFRSSTSVVRVDRSTLANSDVALALAGVHQSVIVTAAAAPQQAEEISKAVSVVTAAEIRDRNEFALTEIVRTAPGVLITTGGGPGQNASIRIRGLRADAAGVLVDGLRLRDATTLQGDASSLVPVLNFINADRVEVLRGSASSLYGTNAVGGVVNVVTGEGGSPWHGDLHAEAGNLGLYRARGAIGGGAFGDRLKFSAGFLHLNVTEGVDGNDANRSTGIQSFLRYDLAPGMNVAGRVWASGDFVRINVSPSTGGVPAANIPAAGAIPAIPLSPDGVAILNAGGRPEYGRATYVPGRDDPDNRRWTRFHTTALTFRHSPGPRAGWQASYQRVHAWREFLNGPLGGGFQPAAENYSNYVGDIDTFDVRGNAQPAAWISLTGGYEFEREAYFDRQLNNLPPPGLISVRTRISQRAHAGYFASRLGMLDRRLHVSFSGRAQGFRLSRPEFETTGAANNYAQAPLAPPKTALTGDLSIAYLFPRPATKLRAHAGNAYRAPALYERFGGGFSANPATGLVNFTAWGDPRLASDRYNSVDAGIDQYLFDTRVRLSATYFYTRIVSVSAFDFSGFINPATDPFRRSSGYLNGPGGISRGVELSWEARPQRSLALNGAYTYANVNQDRALTVAGFFKTFGTPAHLATLVATKRWTRRFDTTADVFRGSGYYTPFFALTSSRAFEFPGFTKVDLGAAYRFREGEAGSARVFGKVENVFNERYYHNGWLAPRATFVIGLGYGF
jgi:vitamin B12 transporter